MTVGEQGVKYDLNQIYHQVFGYVRPPYPTLAIKSGTVGYNPVGTVRALRGVFNFSSGLGTAFTMPTKLNDFQLPNEPTIRITGSKNIIETKLTRLDPVGLVNKQNVLEEINLNNFRIMIQGIMINEDDPEDYPETQMRELRDILLTSGSVRIENALCSMWGISQVAFQDWDFKEVKGNIAVQAYSLVAYSDEFIDLEVAQPERR